MKMMTTYISQFGLLNLCCYLKENVKYYQRVNKVSFNYPPHTVTSSPCWYPHHETGQPGPRCPAQPHRGVTRSPPKLCLWGQDHQYLACPKTHTATGQLKTSTQLKLSSAMSPQEEEFFSSPKCLHWLELWGQLLTTHADPALKPPC